MGIQNIQKSPLPGTITIDSSSEGGTCSSINSGSSDEEGWLTLTFHLSKSDLVPSQIPLLAREAFKVQFEKLVVT